LTTGTGKKKTFHQIHHFKRTAMTALLFLTENVTQISGKMFKTICYGFIIFWQFAASLREEFIEKFLCDEQVVQNK
jgi:hypothetical protein